MPARGGYQAANLVGGLEAWAAQGLPLGPEGAYVARSGVRLRRTVRLARRGSTPTFTW
jgi:hypothetical protein